MKKKLIYILMICGALFMTTACSEEYTDATSMHVYGPNENPPVKTDEKGTVTSTFDKKAGDPVPATISIEQYETIIQQQLGMTVDELMSAIESGKVVVCPINASRSVWNKAKANVEGKKYGWYVNKNGNVCEIDDVSLYGIIEFDAATKCFNFYPDGNAGGAASIEFGFALDGPNYNTAIRFVMAMTVFDKSFIIQDITIPAGDYNAYSLTFESVAENINYVFGMSSAELVAAVSDGAVKPYIMNLETNAYVWDGTSTANNGGYWCNANNEICTWGADGFSFFIEPSLEDDPACMAIGRAPGIASGTTMMVKFGLATPDKQKAMSFLLNATFE